MTQQTLEQKTTFYAPDRVIFDKNQITDPRKVEAGKEYLLHSTFFKGKPLRVKVAKVVPRNNTFLTDADVEFHMKDYGVVPYAKEKWNPVNWMTLA